MVNKWLKLHLVDLGAMWVKFKLVDLIGCLSDTARIFFLQEALSPTPETEIKGYLCNTPLGEKLVPEDLV